MQRKATKLSYVRGFILEEEGSDAAWQVKYVIIGT